MSETGTARSILAPYCQGNGLDIGAGGDPICPSSICLDRDPSDGRRSHVGNNPTHLVGDAANLYWFRDGCLDYVYSSHCLEDADDTRSWLVEWARVLRPGGLLVLFLPDQKTYEQNCANHGTIPNQAHKHADFSLDYVKRVLPESLRVIREIWPFPGNPYSFAVVCEKS